MSKIDKILYIAFFTSLILLIITMFVYFFGIIKLEKEPLENVKVNTGIASWYDYELPEYPDYSKNHQTCASRDYNRGIYLIVSYGSNMVICRVNDYIEHPDRIIDLSSVAFKKLAPLSLGLLPVEVKQLTY